MRTTSRQCREAEKRAIRSGTKLGFLDPARIVETNGGAAVGTGVRAARRLISDRTHQATTCFKSLCLIVGNRTAGRHLCLDEHLFVELVVDVLLTDRLTG